MTGFPATAFFQEVTVLKYQNAHARKPDSAFSDMLQNPKRKKVFIVCMAVFFVAAAGLSFSLFHSCGKSDNSVKTNGKDVLVTKAEQISGSWTPDSITYYDFGSDGKGSMYTSMNTYTFNYTISNNTFHIDFNNESASDCDYIAHRNGDILKLTDINTKQVYQLHREKRS